ncbi:peptidyl-prolyl cis-trans isomerase [Roseospira visakhapatnamensis]|uniref:Parvulin-like PPIase n=1 Tax=Roseospira visakhapatnamensis TaxID=390880 RepID=A0A7W6WBZ1_9PROT|nr:peptidyl-prolyl cis-trans isomerase [Roseospira visakhapatnamensis]MBB4268052.1 peptidyl-prolyl cis-trans isomerase D [Roseospira visakhapatnamensis]
MLDSFRKASKSWLAKGLLGLLILSFGAWGIGDFLTGGGDAPPAITVGEVRVGTEDLRAEFNREVNALREQLGTSFTAEQAIQFGFLDRAIGRVVTEVTLSQTARDWGMVVPDTAVARVIRETPAFQGEDGGFDRARYERLLSLNGLTEATYTAGIRNDLMRATLTQPVVGGATAPRALVDALHRVRNESRRGDSVAVTIADVPPPGDGPDAAALEALYQDNLDAFTAPEYRAVTAIVLDVEDARALIEVSDTAIEEAYQARQDEFTLPERREVTQVRVADEATARAVVDAVRGGADLDAATAEAGAPAPEDLGEITPDTLPGDLGETVFSLAEGTVSDPVQSAFGWHVFRVRAVVTGGTQSLDDVRETLRADLENSRAGDALYDLSVQLDDALGGGATLEQAAESLALDLLTIDAVDRQGTAPDGTPVAALQETPRVLSAAFSAEAGETSLMQETDSGYFVLRVDSVTPPTPRPLDAVRDEVERLWTERQQARRALDIAERLHAAAGEGRTLAAAAEAEGLTVTPLPAVHRDGRAVDPASRPIPGQLVQALFDMDQGDLRVVKAGSAVHVVRLTEVTAGADDADARAALAEQVTADIADDLFVQFTDALSRQLGVTINRAVIEDAF